ncbi:MAG: O-antigen ligase family protein [Planctomycetales bacterium]|nr:O-antigen ligase family protein [Planctomycetales bacterium]
MVIASGYSPPDIHESHDDAIADVLDELTPILDEDPSNARWSRAPALWLVAVYIGLFIIRPWEVIAPWLGDLRFEKVYAIGMIAVVALTGRKWKPTAQCISVIAFASAVALSAVFAWNSALSWEPLYRYATVVVTYFLFVSVIRQAVDLYFLIMTYVGVMWVYIAKSLWEYFVNDRHEFAQNVPRLVGIDLTYGETNAVAMSVVLSLPFWMFLWRRRKSLTTDWPSSWSKGYVAAVATYPVLAVTAVLLTNSRAGMLGTGMFVVLAHIRSTRKTSWAKSAAMGFALIVLLWIVAPQQQKDRLSTLWDPSSGPSNAHASADGRWLGFLAGIEMFERKPIFGVGIGNFLDYRISFLDGVPKIAHNLPGEILGETGLAGAVTFLVMVVFSWRNCRRTISICRGSAAPTFMTFHELALALSNSILLLLLFGLSLHNALRFNWLWIAAFAMCLALCARHADDSEMSIHEPSYA